MKAIYDPNLGLGWDEEGQPVADSRRVAAQFDKRHADVLRDKEALNAKLRSASRDRGQNSAAGIFILYQREGAGRP
jgi:phage regulator Rha-like protein